MKLLEIEGHVLQCLIASDATVMYHCTMMTDKLYR